MILECAWFVSSALYGWMYFSKRLIVLIVVVIIAFVVRADVAGCGSRRRSKRNKSQVNTREHNEDH
jgi:hypothetical protein